MIRTTLGVLAVGAGLSALAAAQVPPAEAPAPRESAPAPWAGGKKSSATPATMTVDSLEKLCKRPSPLRKVNGVTLDVVARVEHDFAGDVIVLEWFLDYDGPRPPLVILGPTFEGKTGKATRVDLFAAPEGGRVAWGCPFTSVTGKKLVVGGPPRPADLSPLGGLGGEDFVAPKDLFVTLRPGKQTSGKLRVPAADLRRELAGRGVEKAFDPKSPPRVFAKMWHAPKDRGEKYSLDAWTGELESDVLEVPTLESW